MSNSYLSLIFFTLLGLSVRWGLAIALLALCFRLVGPIRAQARLVLCQVVLIGGCGLLAVPIFWGPVQSSFVRMPGPVGSAANVIPDRQVSLAASQNELPQSDLVAFRPVRTIESARADAPNPDTATAPARLPASSANAHAITLPARDVEVDAQQQNKGAKSSAGGLGMWCIRALVLTWFGGVAFSALRLFAGWNWLRRLRRTSIPASAAAIELLDRCRHELRLSAPITLLSHSRVQTPALIGHRYPAILLPANWDELPLINRRAALLHELTHLANRDHWAKLVDESVRAVFFFHPLVLWLLNCLDGAREELCDASVVNHGTAPHELARVLLEFAKQQQAEPELGQWGLASSFLRQATVKDRIHHLLEENYMRRTKPLPRRWKFTLAFATLALLTGLGGFGLRSEAAQQKMAAVGPDDKPSVDNKVSAVQEQKAGALLPLAHGTVVDESGRPVADATVLLHRVLGKAKPVLTQTDAEGKFTFTALPGDKKNGFALRVVAVHAGFAPAEGNPFNEKAVKLVLNKPAIVTGTLKDRLGKPIANAHVQMGVVENHGTSRSWGYSDREALHGTIVEPFFLASTDAGGKFQFTTAPAGKEIIFRTEAQGFADFDTSAGGARGGYFAKPDSSPCDLLLEDEARVEGQVVSSVPGVPVAGLVVYAYPSSNSAIRKQTATDANGRFSFGGMSTLAFDLWLEQPENQPCTSRVSSRMNLRVGETASVKLELIPGVLVEGRAMVSGTNAPVAGASVEVKSRDLPRYAAILRQVKTDEQGRYSLRLPPGNVTLFTRNYPGDIQPSREGGQPALVIPEGVARIAGPTLKFEPKTALPRQVPLEGRVVDARGEPVAGATIVGMCRANNCVLLGGDKVVTDARGHFRIAHGPQGEFSPGEATALQVEPPGCKVFEAHIVAKDGQVEVRLPTLAPATAPTPTQAKVRPDELVGLVLDENRHPLEGVHVHISDWVDRPENQALTDKDGRFRLSEKSHGSKVQVRFRKPGYSPVMFVQQPLGVSDLVVVMDSKTYFQGVVYGPDGKPAPNALLRANQGPKRSSIGLITEVRTDARADATGHYRLYVEPDSYEFVVKAPGVGTARLPKRPISHGETPNYDIKLQVPVIFRAQVADSVTGKPVQGLRLYNWRQKDVDGRSDASGTILIDDMLPGLMQFEVESNGYARWWSADAAKEHQQFQGPEFDSSWQRNFDKLDFDVQLGKAPVHIIVEKGVQITGRVLDPDGKPVAVATVAPALTGSGNSLTGDTRFSVLSGADGNFAMLLPASGKAEYNLVVHDGKYQQWRQWANGVLPPIQTSPGQRIKDITIALTQSATVRGKVVDAQGKPVAGREVRASAADKMENRYYDPTTKTKEDGTFELRFIRAGKQLIQVAPFWLSAGQAPAGTSKTVTLKDSETVESVNLTAIEPRR